MKLHHNILFCAQGSTIYIYIVLKAQITDLNYYTNCQVNSPLFLYSIILNVVHCVLSQYRIYIGKGWPAVHRLIITLGYLMLLFV